MAGKQRAVEARSAGAWGKAQHYVAGFRLPEEEMQVWGPDPKSCTLMTSQNVRVWGPLSPG